MKLAWFAGARLFTHSVIQQMFIEHQLYPRYFAGHWDYSETAIPPTLRKFTA